ncbi:MAG: hypothetical protein JAZ11_13260 [Candidatus Thiodiazotropha lotti]|nr:hypothetical protein [Candidatus Thiodiazotropha lotti]
MPKPKSGSFTFRYCDELFANISSKKQINRGIHMAKGAGHTAVGYTKRSLHRLTVLLLAFLSAVVLAQTPPPRRSPVEPDAIAASG